MNTSKRVLEPGYLHWFYFCQIAQQAHLPTAVGLNSCLVYSISYVFGTDGRETCGGRCILAIRKQTKPIQFSSLRVPVNKSLVRHEEDMSDFRWSVRKSTLRMWFGREKMRWIKHLHIEAGRQLKVARGEQTFQNTDPKVSALEKLVEFPCFDFIVARGFLCNSPITLHINC